MESGIPSKTESFLAGQDILYTQFNDLSFFVEDENQENLYFHILKKIFSNIKINKIFPLNGKINVVSEAKINLGNKRKIYIVDKDFDDILGNDTKLENLFYLNRYSIENYLIENNAIIDIIIEEKPKLNKKHICMIFNLESFNKEAVNLFNKLISSYLVIQKHKLGIKNVKYNPEKFCIFNPTSELKINEYHNYNKQIEQTLKSKDKRHTITGQITVFKKHSKKLANIPGKYLIKFLNSRLKYLFNINIEIESFTFRLAKNSELNSLNHLKNSVINYIA